MTSVAAIDHVIYDVFGQQDVPQTAGSGQAATQVGFQGMLIDPLAGFHFVGGGSGGGTAATPWPIPPRGFTIRPTRVLRLVSETHLTGGRPATPRRGESLRGR